MTTQASSEFGARFRAVLIEGGLTRNRRIYMPDVLEAAVPLFGGVPVHGEHGGAVVGHVSDVAFEVFTDGRGRRWPQVLGTLNIACPRVRRALVHWRAHRARPFGVSVVLSIDTRPLQFAPGDVWAFVTRITAAHAADLTERAAAGGRVLGICTGLPRFAATHGRADSHREQPR